MPVVEVPLELHIVLAGSLLHAGRKLSEGPRISGQLFSSIACAATDLMQAGTPAATRSS